MPAMIKKDYLTHYPIYLSALVRNYLSANKITVDELALQSSFDAEFLQQIINQKINDLTRTQMIELAETLKIPVHAVIYPCDIIKKDIESTVDAIYDYNSKQNELKYMRLDPVAHLERMSYATEKAMAIQGYKNIDDCIKENPNVPKMVLHTILKRKMNSMRADTLASIAEALNISPFLLAGIEQSEDNNPIDTSNSGNVMQIPLYASTEELKNSAAASAYITVQGIQKSFQDDQLSALISCNTQHNLTISIITKPRFDPYTNTKHLYELSDGYIIEVSLHKSSANTSKIEILDRVESLTDEHKSKIIGRIVTSIIQYKSTDKK